MNGAWVQSLFIEATTEAFNTVLSLNATLTRTGLAVGHG
jgi:hypothetical protein